METLRDDEVFERIKQIIQHNHPSLEDIHRDALLMKDLGIGTISYMGIHAATVKEFSLWKYKKKSRPLFTIISVLQAVAVLLSVIVIGGGVFKHFVKINRVFLLFLSLEGSWVQVHD